VVGQGILRLLRDNQGSIESRLGGPIDVVRVVVRDRDKRRDPAIGADRLGTDARAIIDDPSIDVVVEVMGGLAPAGEYVQAAIEAGKHVVTANKALLAEHGDALIELAERRGVDLYFEAAVGGGIPIIRVLREAFASDRIVALRGIVNGTSNYVLTRMHDAGLDFQLAVREAQDAGYAEADPSLDVGGGDAAHKLAILATLAFGAKVDPAQIATAGIDQVGAVDMEFARRFGFVVKPLAIARLRAPSVLSLRVHPALVGERSVLGTIQGALNAVYLEGAMAGPCLLSGLGAGALPTAMSVVSDIVDVGRNLLVGAHGRVPSRAFRGEHLSRFTIEAPGEHEGCFYLRFVVLDRPGVLARIAGLLGTQGVSIEQMVQDGRGGKGDLPVSIVMLTHPAREAAVRAAVSAIDALTEIAEPTRCLHVELG
jgi:homoserine dehydrogenase